MAEKEVPDLNEMSHYSMTEEEYAFNQMQAYMEGVNEGFKRGVRAGIRLYATWKDGVEVVGCMKAPLATVLDGLTEETYEAIRQNYDH